MPERDPTTHRPRRRDPADGDSLRDALHANLDEGLVPLRMATPEPNEGLRVLSFSDGLDQLSVDAMRRGPRKMRNQGGELDVDGIDRYTAIARDGR